MFLHSTFKKNIECLDIFIIANCIENIIFFFSNGFNRYLLAFYNFFSFTQKYLSIWYLRSVVFQIYFCCQLEKNTTLLVTYHRKRDHTVSRWYETFARPRKSPSFFSLDHFCFTSTRHLFLYYNHQTDDNWVKKCLSKKSTYLETKSEANSQYENL